MTHRYSLAALAVFSLASFAQGAFDADGLYVVRLGGNTSGAQTVYLDEYDRATGTLRGFTNLSTAGGAFSLPGVNDHDGLLRFSTDGSLLTLGGYHAAVGTPNPSADTAAVTNRAIATISSSGVVNTGILLPDAYDQTTLRAVVTVDGSAFYTVGGNNYTDLATGNTITVTNGGLRLVTAGGSSTNLANVDIRGTRISGQDASISGGSPAVPQLYVTTGSGSSFPQKGAFRTTVSLPTSAASFVGEMTTTDTPSGADDSNIPKSDIVFLDLSSSVPGMDTAYTTGGKSDFEKWTLTLVSGAYKWIETSVTNKSGPSNINALDAYVTGNTVTLLAANDTGIYKLTDATGYGGAFSANFPATAFITAPAGQVFRGIAVAPVPEPGTLALLAAGGLAVMRRRTRRGNA
jgi:hypothetical protein